MLPEVYKLFCFVEGLEFCTAPSAFSQKTASLLVGRNNIKLGASGERLFTKACSDGMRAVDLN